jgi:GNAT superfamily N-acetyltransferase
VLYMDIQIKDFRENPEKFGPELFDIRFDCLRDMAERIGEDPRLGEYDSPSGALVCSSGQLVPKETMRREEGSEYLLSLADGGFFGVALDDREVLGGGYVRLSENQKVYLSDFYVSPDHQRQGVGTYLLKVLESVAGEWCPDSWTMDGDSWVYRPALQFYEKNGYKITGMVMEIDIGQFKIPSLRVSKQFNPGSSLKH